jgi:hypothetical protein
VPFRREVTELCPEPDRLLPITPVEPVRN